MAAGGEQVNNVKREYSFTREVSNASKHFIESHDRDLAMFSVVGIERVNRPKRGGDWSKCVMNNGAYWIMKLQTWYPQGLNYRTNLMYF